MTKKKPKRIVKSLEIPFLLAGTSIGSNLLGSALGKQLPTGTANPLISLGTSSGKAAGIAGTIAFTGIILEETSKLKPKKKQKFKKIKVHNTKLTKTYKI